MKVVVAFQDRSLGLEIEEPRLVGHWQGPAGLPTAEAAEALARALEAPLDFPPLRQAVVPGDRVVVPLGADVPEPAAVVAAMAHALGEIGLGPDSITVLTTPDAPESPAFSLPTGVTLKRHDPADRTSLAYLASTPEGRRIYLHRDLVDADLVVPVGRLRHDPVFGYRGPWSVVYPDMSDEETRSAFHGRLAAEPAPRESAPPSLRESNEVGWLLGCQLQLGLVAGVGGLAVAVAGLAAAVQERGAAEVDRLWGFNPSERAELVIAGVGAPGAPAGVNEVAAGLAAATRLVRRGGKIVLLSEARGEFGPALRMLSDLGEPLRGMSALRGREAAADYGTAVKFARAVAWADVYVHAKLNPDDLDALSIIPLDRPEDARRLASQAASCIVLSQADLVGAGVAGESE